VIYACPLPIYSYVPAPVFLFLIQHLELPPDIVLSHQSTLPLELLTSASSVIMTRREGKRNEKVREIDHVCRVAHSILNSTRTKVVNPPRKELEAYKLYGALIQHLGQI
jgi:hypothetical protein